MVGGQNSTGMNEPHCPSILISATTVCLVYLNKLTEFIWGKAVESLLRIYPSQIIRSLHTLAHHRVVMEC